jgi:hypothetical protein
MHEMSSIDLTGKLNRSCSHHFNHLHLALQQQQHQDKQQVSNLSQIKEIQLEESPLKLVFNPEFQTSRESKIDFILTDESCCEKSFTKISALLAIEGRQFEQILEPEPNLKISFGWNRTDAFGQKVFGEVSSVLKIGFEFDDCEQTIWETRVVTIRGHDSHLDDFSGWTLNVQHRFEPKSGVVHLGDGSRIDLKSDGPSLRPVQTLFEMTAGNKKWICFNTYIYQANVNNYNLQH